MKKIIIWAFLFIGMLLIASCGNSEGGGDNKGIKNTDNIKNNSNENSNESSSVNSNGVFTRDDVTKIITQTKSNLITMWQDDEEVISLNKYRTEADYYCAKLQLGGYSDWHLPASSEIRGIYNDKTKKIESIFKNMNTLVGRYWVSEYTNGISTFVWFSSTKLEVKKDLSNTEMSARCHRDVRRIL